MVLPLKAVVLIYVLDWLYFNTQLIHCFVSLFVSRPLSFFSCTVFDAKHDKVFSFNLSANVLALVDFIRLYRVRINVNILNLEKSGPKGP